MSLAPSARRGSAFPAPLFAVFVLFLAAIAYLVAASLTRRTAPVFSPSPLARVRPGGWERGGDTLTIDGSDGDRWRYVSLAQGRVLAPPDTTGWQIAVQRYRVIADAAIADLGVIPFESARIPDSAAFVANTGAGAQMENAAIKHWYRYNLLTHLLDPSGRVYAVRARDGRLWKLAIVSYYCPRLEAGCLTIRYAPFEAPE